MTKHIPGVEDEYVGLILKEGAEGFPNEVVRQAFAAAGEACECTRMKCGHETGRCPQKLRWEDRTTSGTTAVGWQAHHKTKR